MSREDDIRRRLAAAEPDEWVTNNFTWEAMAPSKDAFDWLLNAPADMEWLLDQIERLSSQL